MANMNIKTKDDLIKLIETLDTARVSGEYIDEETLATIDECINGSKEGSMIDSSFEYFIKSKLQKIKQYVLNQNSNGKKVTRWDVFVNDMKKSKKEGIEPVIELIDKIDAGNDCSISEEEVAEIEKLYKKIVPILYEFSVYDKELAMKEFGKKIKLFKNRLNRVVENDFGIWMKQLRKAKGYSLKDLENASGVTASYIHRLESGSRKTPSIPVVENLAVALGIQEDEFFKKLGLMSSSEKNSEPVPFIELISLNNFMINGKVVNHEQKDCLIDLFNCILSATWTTESKLSEGMVLLQKVDE